MSEIRQQNRLAATLDWRYKQTETAPKKFAKAQRRKIFNRFIYPFFLIASVVTGLLIGTEFAQQTLMFALLVGGSASLYLVAMASRPKRWTRFLDYIILLTWFVVGGISLLFLVNLLPYNDALLHRYGVALGLMVVACSIYFLETPRGKIRNVINAIRNTVIKVWRAHYEVWLYIRRKWHRAWLFDIASPFVRSQNPLRQAYRYWRGIISFRNRTFLYLAALVVGGIVIPVTMHFLANYYDPEPVDIDPNLGVYAQNLLPIARTLSDNWKLEPLQLVLIGIVSSIVLLFVAELGYNSLGRSRYVFGEFSPLISADPTLGKIAEDLRRAVITELQLTAGLLKQRQVENFNLSQEDSNAFFVSSGFDQEFLEKIEDIVSIDVPTGRINLAQLSLLYARTTAKVFATGRVTRQQTGGIEIRVEMRHWLRSPINAYARIDALVANETIDSQRIQLAAREIALKLLLELNQVTGVGSSWHTFDAFLKGLKAAATQHWWQAISYYNQALDTGPSEPHDRFGVIYFHLGSALVFQGSWESGMELLRKAEEYGPPIPETHYMLAFVLLYEYWGELAKARGIFNQIEYHCQRAITLRPAFPQAYHLLGTANYRRGRVIERNAKDNKKEAEKAKISYAHAMKAYRRALDLYDKEIARLSRDVKASSHIGHALLLQRMTVEHQLADSLRGLGRWFEAEQHYKNMQLLFPANLRNLADLLKTYCLADQWKYGKLVLYRSFLDIEPAQWDADVLVHAGWMMARRAQTRDKSKADQERKERKKRVAIAEATMYIDFTLLMRPRYVNVWAQTNWKKPFDEATSQYSLDDVNVDDNIRSLMQKGSWYKSWIDNRQQAIKNFQDNVTAPPKWLPSTLRTPYETYMDRVHQVATQEENAIKNVRDIGLARRFERIDAADELHRLWEQFDNWVQTKLADTPTTVTGRLRLTIDVYVQVTLFTARMLAEACMYELLITVAENACQRLTVFHSMWERDTKPSPPNEANRPILTPLVYYYGMVSVRAWYAYAVLAADQDFITRCMQPPTHQTDLTDPEAYAARTQRFANARRHLEEARKFIPVHPLLVFVQAQYAAHDGLYAEAIDGMKTVLNIVAPIDPKRDVGGSIATPQPPAPTSSEDRSTLYFLERIIGRQQFHNIVNPVSIHLEIARYAAVMNDIERAVRHQSEAVRSSPFSDTHRDILLELAENLSSMERYGDANAVIDTLRTTRAKIGHVALSPAKQFSPDVLDTIVATRRGRQAEALMKAQTIAQNLEYVSIKMLISRVRKVYADNQRFVTAFTNHANSVLDLISQKRVTLEKTEKTIAKFARVFPPDKVEVGGQTLWQIQERVIAHIMNMDEYKSMRRNDILLPLIFGQLEALGSGLQDALNTLTALACLSQQRKTLQSFYADWLNHHSKTPLSNADKMQFMQVALFLGRQARDFLIHIADICNALAYNRATMQHGFSYYAPIDVRTALNIMLFLREITDSDHETYNGIVRRLAQYCDTLGWVEFARLLPTPRNGLTANGAAEAIEKNYENLLKGLKAATEYLELGVHYDPSRAIIHYHLAHIHLHAVEVLQEQPGVRSHTNAIAKAYLERAKTELEVAERNDPHGRLRDPIRDAILWYRHLSASFTHTPDKKATEPPRSSPLVSGVEV